MVCWHQHCYPLGLLASPCKILKQHPLWSATGTSSLVTWQKILQKQLYPNKDKYPLFFFSCFRTSHIVKIIESCNVEENKSIGFFHAIAYFSSNPKQ